MLLDTLEEGAFVLAENLIEPAIVKVPAENISKFLFCLRVTHETLHTQSVSLFSSWGELFLFSAFSPFLPKLFLFIKKNTFVWRQEKIIISSCTLLARWSHSFRSPLCSQLSYFDRCCYGYGLPAQPFCLIPRRFLIFFLHRKITSFSAHRKMDCLDLRGETKGGNWMALFHSHGSPSALPEPFPLSACKLSW